MANGKSEMAKSFTGQADDDTDPPVDETIYENIGRCVGHRVPPWF
jgi:hypothetical protein